MGVKLMNQGQRNIRFGKEPDEVLRKGAVGIFSPTIAKKLIKLYSKELVDLDNLSVSYEKDAVKDFSGSKKKAKGGESDDALADGLNDK